MYIYIDVPLHDLRVCATASHDFGLIILVLIRLIHDLSRNYLLWNKGSNSQLREAENQKRACLDYILKKK